MEIVKFFHFIGLMLGAGAGFGTLGVAIAQKKLGGGPPPDAIKKIKPVLGMFGLSGIVLLWLTGVIMVGGIDSAQLGALFTTKLVVAGAMLLISLWLMYQGMKAAKSGTPPPSYMDKLGRTSAVLSIVAVALAVAVFG